MKTPVYLDNNASTPVDPRAVDRMIHVLRHDYGNPSSKMHGFGNHAADIVETARKQVAELIGARPREIVFTSSATESCNLAIKGVAQMYTRQGKHIVTCVSEHKSVLAAVDRLQSREWNVSWLSPDRYGRISAEEIDEAVNDGTILISIMAANNVVGTLNPIAEISRVAERRGVLLHCDATQAIGKIPVDVEAMGVDLLSLSAHKFYGPKGVGALYIRGRSPKVRLAAQIDGGGHEGGLRSGTLNVPGIVGMGMACEIAGNQLDEDARRMQDLRDRLQAGLSQRIANVTLNGHPQERLPNTLNVAFDGVTVDEFMENMPDIAVSAGSACASGTDDPNYVLRAMGCSEQQAGSSVRFSVGRFTTVEEIDYCIEKVAATIKKLSTGNESSFVPMTEMLKKTENRS